jgi:hypothetical protein
LIDKISNLVIRMIGIMDISAQRRINRNSEQNEERAMRDLGDLLRASDVRMEPGLGSDPDDNDGGVGTILEQFSNPEYTH